MIILDRIIGHGTWYDKIATEIIKREQKIGRSLKLLRVESGVAASGIPHIGSISEVTRNYAVSLAIKVQKYNSEFIVFSDNKDGLRSIPKGFPISLKKYLGFPVTMIPDPYSCHASYGNHMVDLLLEGMDKINIKYKIMKGVDVYEKGLLTKEIQILLKNAKNVGRIVKEETGQEKYLKTLPYFPVCASCRRIYTTNSFKHLSDENKVLYSCEGIEIKNNKLEGCGYKGEADYSKGEGKLSWKAGEFAARWSALGIRFEAYGKDIADSVRVNDRISREILGYEPPMHVQYEMFLDKGGKKISKSKGNVFTPQIWFRYGSPRSMVLLTLKRFVGTRNISISDIPKYMDEFDELEEIYFGEKKIRDLKEKTKLNGLYKYCWFMKTPIKSSIHIPYNMLINLAKVAPKDFKIEFIKEKIKNYGYKKNDLNDLERRIQYALSWVKDFEESIETFVELTLEERNGIIQLIKKLELENKPEVIQYTIFKIAKDNGIKPKIFFKKLYLILLGISSGPRLGTYIIDMGKENAIKTFKNILLQNK
jgi:lysyl-tRNA synthetase class 1